MAEKKNRIMRRRLRNAYLSSLISISLVLLLVGIAAMLLVNARSVSDYFKENMQVSVMMKTEVSDEQAMTLLPRLEELPFIVGTRFVSKEQGTREMAQMLGDDFLSVFESTPIPASIVLNLQADYVSSDSLAMVRARIEREPMVDEVVYQQSLVEDLNVNLGRISLVLGVFILLLLFISFVLIGNTVRLSLYDRRFVIHTMKLVGATRGFIRAPFMVTAVFQGLFASLMAILMLVGILYVVRREFSQLFEVFRLDLLLWVVAIVVAAGLAICLLSTWLSVYRLGRLTKDELYY